MKKIFLLYIIPFLIGFSQTKKDSIVVVPGKEYEAGAIHQFFFGSHWRDLWITPVKVEVLDLKTFAGGLTPIKKGGGFATKSLRFKGNDGQYWKFRSVDKDPRKTLPVELRNTLVGSILMDQTSTSNPMAPLVVVPILNAVGVLQAVPKLVWLPDTELLGKYRKEFGGLLGMIEVHPDEGEDGKEGFAGSEKVKGTFKLFHKLDKNVDERIDPVEFLKARLVDIFLGDWDRHTDQWRWAMFEEGNKKIWKPIPRDRDQAFARFTGVFPSIAAYYIPQMVHFDEDYPQIEDITWSGRFLDRRILSSLTEAEWDSVAAFVQGRISDKVIEDAVKRLPEKYYELEGKNLEKALKKRRDNLRSFAKEFFELENLFIDIFASEKDDSLVIKRDGELYTYVELYKKATKKHKPFRYYYKKVRNELTKEIRAYLDKGDDYAVIKGESYDSPIIRVVGGKGKDVLVDKSITSSKFMSYMPFNISKRTYFYDSGKKTKVIMGQNTVYDNEKVKDPKSDEEKYEPRQRDRSVDWKPRPIINLNSEHGLLIGGGPQVTRFGFRDIPFTNWYSLTGAYATLPDAYHIEFDAVFFNWIKKYRFEFNIFRSSLLYTNYFGYGNETKYSREEDEQEKYRLEQELFNFSVNAKRKLFKNLILKLSAVYQNSEIHLDNEKYAHDFIIPDYGLGRIEDLSVGINVIYDNRDYQSLATKGNFFSVEYKYFPEIFSLKYPFSNVKLDLRKYISSDFNKETTLALRVAGEANFGKFPFHRSVFLGGDNDLRAYNKKRFAGKYSLFGQAEVRTHITKAKIIVPADMGTFIFAEAGRVFEENDNSEKWHPSVGGGLYLAFLNKAFITAFNIAFSKERKTFSLTFGTAF